MDGRESPNGASSQAQQSASELSRPRMRGQEIVDALLDWVEQEPSIEGVFLVGSHARNEASSESDVDLVLLTCTPQTYLEDTSWISRFGTPSSVSYEDWGNVQSIRVFYAGGPEVEYGITTPDWATHPVPKSTRRVLKDGMRLLFDRTGRFSEAIKRIPDN